MESTVPVSVELVLIKKPAIMLTDLVCMDVNQDTKDYSVMRVTSFLAEKKLHTFVSIKNCYFPFCFLIMFHIFNKKGNMFDLSIIKALYNKNTGRTLSNSN